MIHATYWPEDDILKIQFSDNPIAREVSDNRNVHKRYAADGDLVEVVFLDAVKEGYFDPTANGQKVADSSGSSSIV